MSEQNTSTSARRQPHYTCVICGNPFRSYNPNPQFCSRQCKDQSQIASIDLNEAKRLYDAGHSQDEVAAALGTTQKVIHNAFRRAGIKCRPQVKRYQRGAKNSSWKGDAACYSALHYRVEAGRGKPMCCEVCGTDDPEKSYDWANQTGHYEDINDYKRMCRSCHWKFDDKINNILLNRKEVHHVRD